MQSSNISNNSICTLCRDPAIFHVQIIFKAAMYCHASLLMWTSPSRWWITNWQISQHWVWNYYCLCTSSWPNHVNNEITKCNLEEPHKLQHVGDLHFAHHWFEPTCLTAVTSHCLAALPATKSSFNSYMRQNANHLRNLKCIFEGLLPCYCWATKVN